MPHTYRLELFGADLYKLYIDNELVDFGTPEGPYPTPTAVLSIRAASFGLESTAHWAYIRYGTIPEDGSGDYDSDGDVDGEDLYFFDECFGGNGLDAGPGCRFADFDGDTDVDAAQQN